MNPLIRLEIRSNEPLAFISILEATCMYVGAAIPQNAHDPLNPFTTSFVLETKFATFQINQSSSQEFEIIGWSQPRFVSQACAQFYAILIGLRRAMLTVTCSGHFEAFMPPQDKSVAANKKVRFGRIGCDHQPTKSKNLQITPSELVHWYEHFSSLTTIAEANASRLFPGRLMEADHCFIWKLPQGLMIKSHVEGDQLVDHQILGFTFAEMIFQTGLPLAKPVTRRTWGEAWLPHERTGQILLGLIRLENETAIITNGIYRYQILQRSTIARREMTFGKDAPSPYTVDEWTQFAEHFCFKKNYQVAVRCFKQAELLAETQEQRMDLAKQRSMIVIPRKLRVAKSKSMRQLSLNQLESWIGPERIAKIISIEKGRNDAYLESDFGRFRWEVPQTENGPVDPPTAKSAGMTQEILSQLLGGIVHKFFPNQLSGLFRFSVDEWRIWGGKVRESTLLKESRTRSSKHEFPRFT